MSSVTSLPQFPLLPVELQREIWKAAIHNVGPRIVYITETLRDPLLDKNDPESYIVDGVDIRTQEIDPANPPHQYRSQSTILFLCVCSLSRKVTSEIYTRAFPTHPTSSYIWFDFLRDVLYVNLESQSFLGEEHQLLLKTTHIVLGDISGHCNRVKNFAIVIGEQKAWPGRPYPRSSLRLGMERFANCDNVKRILLVDRQHEWWEDTMDLVEAERAEMRQSVPFLHSDLSPYAKQSGLLSFQIGLGKNFSNLTSGTFYTQEGDARSNWLPRGAKGFTAIIEKRTITTRNRSQEFKKLLEELKQAHPDEWFWGLYSHAVNPRS